MANANELHTTESPGRAGKNAAVSGGPASGDGALGPTTRTEGGDAPQPVAPPDALHIRVDRQDIKISPDLLHDGTLTGQQIRELETPPIAPDRDLFQIVPGGSDRKIEDGDAVVIRDHLRFFSAPRNINPGTAEGLALSVLGRSRSPHRRNACHAAE